MGLEGSVFRAGARIQNGEIDAGLFEALGDRLAARIDVADIHVKDFDFAVSFRSQGLEQFGASGGGDDFPAVLVECGSEGATDAGARSDDEGGGRGSHFGRKVFRDRMGEWIRL